ncbi:nuclear transport factor 2 family protein [Flindersiella endophytica]
MESTQQFLDALERRDLDAAIALLDPDVTWTTRMAADGSQTPGVISGREGVAARLRQLGSWFDKISFLDRRLSLVATAPADADDSARPIVASTPDEPGRSGRLNAESDSGTGSGSGTASSSDGGGGGSSGASSTDPGSGGGSGASSTGTGSGGSSGASSTDRGSGSNAGSSSDGNGSSASSSGDSQIRDAASTSETGAGGSTSLGGHTPDGSASTFVQTNGDFQTRDGRPYRNVYVFRFDWRGGRMKAWEEYANPVTIQRLEQGR